MKRVDIYIEANNTAPRKFERWTGYILECVKKSGDLYTEMDFNRKTGTYHETILRTLIEALGRMKKNSEIHIHTKDKWTLEMIGRNLENWAAGGFVNNKGKPLTNQTEWRKLHDLTKEHLIVKEPGAHSYYNWMQQEMDRRAKREETR